MFKASISWGKFYALKHIMRKECLGNEKEEEEIMMIIITIQKIKMMKTIIIIKI